MPEVSIPEEAIEETIEPLRRHPAVSGTLADLQKVARDVLGAATPLIEAAAYDRAAREYEGLAIEFKHRAETASDGSTAAGLMGKSDVWDDAAEDLRVRASVLRGEGQKDG